MKRLNWIDSSRGMAMMMVIYSHLFYCNEYVMDYLSPIFLTTFFFVSGYLWKDRENFKAILEHRTRTILVPFFFWGIVMVVLRQIVTFNAEKTWQEDVLGLLFQVRGENDQLWFLPAIWVFSLVFFGMNKVAKNEIQLILISIFLFIVNAIYLYWFHGAPFYWHLTLIGGGCFYMTLGKIYKKHESQMDELMTEKKLFVLGLFYVVFVTVSGTSCSFAGSKYIIDSIIMTITGIGLCVYSCKKLFVKSRLLLYVGSNSLLYFVLHGKVISFLQYCVDKIMNIHPSGNLFPDLLIGFLIMLLACMATIIPIYVINKYLAVSMGKGYKLWQ